MATAIEAGKDVLVGVADIKGAALLDINVVAGKGRVVVVDHGGVRKRKVGALANDNAAAHLGKVLLCGAILLGSVVTSDHKAGALGKRRPCTGIEEETGDFVASDGNCRSSVNIELCVSLQQTHASVPVALALGTGDLDVSTYELATASENDAVITVVLGSHRGVINGQVAGRKAMDTVIGEINY